MIHCWGIKEISLSTVVASSSVEMEYGLLPKYLSDATLRGQGLLKSSQATLDAASEKVSDDFTDAVLLLRIPLLYLGKIFKGCAPSCLTACQLSQNFSVGSSPSYNECGYFPGCIFACLDQCFVFKPQTLHQYSLFPFTLVDRLLNVSIFKFKLL